MSWSETLFLKKIIDGQKSLVASDDLYKEFDIYVQSNRGEETTNLQLFKMKNDGSFKIGTELSAGTGNGAYLSIYINGNAVDSVGVSGNTTSESVVSSSIVANKNDVIGYSFYGYYASMTDLKIYAKIVDNSLIKTL